MICILAQCYTLDRHDELLSAAPVGFFMSNLGATPAILSHCDPLRARQLLPKPLSPDDALSRRAGTCHFPLPCTGLGGFAVHGNAPVLDGEPGLHGNALVLDDGEPAPQENAPVLDGADPEITLDHPSLSS